MSATDPLLPAAGGGSGLYRYGSYTVESRIPLTVLPLTEAQAPSRITIDFSPQACPEETYWHHHWLEGDEVVLSLARQGDDYWLRFPDLADFHIQNTAGRILLSPDATADAETLEHLLVDQLLPRLLAQRDQLMVHASAVTIGRHHALFLGPSGWGKSTLAGLLDRHGHLVHSDDCVQMLRAEGGYEALPTYPSLRLYPDSVDAIYPRAPFMAPVASYTEKQRIALEPLFNGHVAVPVDAIFVLGDPSDGGDAVHISPLRPAQTCQALIRHSFRLDLADREGSAAHFARCAELAKTVPAFVLDYRRDYNLSDALVEAITRHLANLLTTASHTQTPCPTTTTTR